jgi:hypothetical protein
VPDHSILAGSGGGETDLPPVSSVQQRVAATSTRMPFLSRGRLGLGDRFRRGSAHQLGRLSHRL